MSSIGFKIGDTIGDYQVIDLLGAGASPLSLMLGLADIAVVVILFVHKPWFDAMRRWRAEG